MKTKDKKHIIIVLGMHRSGTSAVARGLQVLGVDLGAHLMPPMLENNEKGFFEDMDVYALDVEILNTLHRDWHSLSLLPASTFNQESMAAFKLNAINLISTKVGNQPFGLKDPRIARLLPFWQSVMAHLNIELSYVIVVRNPKSVTESLQKRDGINVEKGYYLWLEHALPSILETTNANRVVVDFDLLMANPKAQLERIAKAINLPFNPNAQDFEEYTCSFLDKKLRHTQYNLEDLHHNSAVPADVIVAYRLLERLARDKTNADEPAVGKTFQQIRKRLQIISPALNYMACIDGKISERDGQIAGLNEAVAERDGQIAGLNRIISEYRESTSWKLTAPLRWSVHQVKHVRHVLQISHQLLEKSGGMKATSSKALHVLRREGLKGVKNRIKTNMGKSIVIAGTSEAVDRNDYKEWIRRYDSMTEKKLTVMRKKIKEMQEHPIISVVMPVYNPNPVWLAEAIESVQHQIYTDWEFCIADDASTNPEIKPLLEKYAKEDSRIKVVFREENGHISAASNSALELVSGDWVALLDHDDVLPEHALFWVADAINQHPEAKLIYSDEDKIDESGNRITPYFKPDWNPDLFLSHNHICHLGIYKASLVKQSGGFREGLEGAQDYDLALRCVEKLAPIQIIHIPRVLYHWRIHKGSTALAGSEKNYALLAVKRALNDHFKRQNIAAKSELLDFGMYRVHYDLPKELPLISIIIPTHNGLKLIQQCIEGVISKTTYTHYEIIIIDNNSDDPDTLLYLDGVTKNNKIRVLQDPRPFNYSQLNNSAIEQAQGEFVLLMNNDIEVITPDWLSEMASIAIQRGVGCVGARLWYPNDTLQHGGLIAGVGGVAGHSHKHLARGEMGYFAWAALIQSMTGVTAACLLVRKSIYEAVGGLNEQDLSVAFNDVDFCLKVRQGGYRNVWTPYAELYHHESATRGYENTPEKMVRFSKEVLYMQKKWSDILMNDPAYNPNLTLDYEDFSLAWPPRISDYNE